jgi:Fe2+ or Zn2+ uptake regulation protein
MPLPQTQIPGRLQTQLAERGIRMTGPRRAILSVIETATKHLDASQILRKARTVDESVDRSTVYRTLGLLKRQGLIDELERRRPLLRTQAGPRSHSHGVSKVWEDQRVCQQNFRVVEKPVRAGLPLSYPRGAARSGRILLRLPPLAFRARPILIDP